FLPPCLLCALPLSPISLISFSSLTSLLSLFQAQHGGGGRAEEAAAGACGEPAGARASAPSAGGRGVSPWAPGPARPAQAAGEQPCRHRFQAEAEQQPAREESTGAGALEPAGAATSATADDSRPKLRAGGGWTGDWRCEQLMRAEGARRR
ncbi:unnamed protein product, partial [Urochloa humidicola]